MSYFAFFIHGGPGLNSFPEASLLGPVLEKRRIQTVFWNEPSAHRPTRRWALERPSFPIWMKALETEFLEASETHGEKLQLIAHSFGAIGAAKLALAFPDRVAGLTMVSPALCSHEAQKNIVGLAIADFAGISSVKEAELRHLAESSRSSYDPPMRAALALAMTDPDLFTHYWKDPQGLLEWSRRMAAPEWKVDLASFDGVLSTLELGELREQPLPPRSAIPVLLAMGTHDPVINSSCEESLARNIFMNMRRINFNESKHFPHLEQRELFAEALSRKFKEDSV